MYIKYLPRRDCKEVEGGRALRRQVTLPPVVFSLGRQDLTSLCNQSVPPNERQGAELLIASMQGQTYDMRLRLPCKFGHDTGLSMGYLSKRTLAHKLHLASNGLEGDRVAADVCAHVRTDDVSAQYLGLQIY